MILQNHTLESRKALQSPIADVVHYHFDGRGVPVACQGCGRRASDVRKALFSVNRPNHYVISRWEICPKCQGRKNLCPIHGATISWDALNNKGLKIEAGAKYSAMVRPAENPDT
jgi:hypothetical protein